jgi:hypothetical protein
VGDLEVVRDAAEAEVPGADAELRLDVPGELDRGQDEGGAVENSPGRRDPGVVGM